MTPAASLLVAIAWAAMAVEPATATEPALRDHMATVAPNLKALDVPAPDPAVAARIDQYQNTRAARFADWLPDGGMLIGTRFGQTRQIHRVDGPMGARQQLTFEQEPLYGPLAATWQGREGFFFMKDVGGAEAYQLLHFDLATGAQRLMTDGTSRNHSHKLSRDGRRLAFSSTARNGTDFDIWLLDLGDPKPRPLLERQGLWQAIDWSPDGRELLVRHFVSANESTLHRLDLTTGKLTALFPPARQQVAFGAARYDGKGKAVYAVSNWWGEHMQLSRVDLKTGGAKPVTDEIPWDVTALDIDPKGKLLAFVTNEGGIGRLHVWKVGKHKPVKLPDIPVGVISGVKWGAKGRYLALTVQSATGPADAWVVDIRKRKLIRWTHSEVGGLNTDSLVAPTLVEYPTFDQGDDGLPRRIPAFYYRPAGAGPFPVVMLVHGGPESQFRPRFSATIQYWVRELGIAVVAPNVRGSAGYGKKYLLLDNGLRREDSVKDIGALLDWIAAQPELDARRVGVYGGSYGGYMVLASMARFADRLRAGAEIVGISNFVTFLENTKPYRQDLRRAEYGDEREPAMRKHLEAISPTTIAGDIRAPLFVAQGLNDPRVPASESDQIVASVRSRDVPCWYLLAEDEGHGFRKKANRDFHQAALATFWTTYLLPETPPHERPQKTAPAEEKKTPKPPTAEPAEGAEGAAP